MKTTLHNKSSWFDKFEIAGDVLQVIIAVLVMVVLAVMASNMGGIWTTLY